MFKKESRSESRVRRHTRVRAKVSGTPSRPRLCVFRSNKNIEVQIIDDTKGVTLVSSSSSSLKLENGGNVDAAKTIGVDIAKKAKAKKIKAVVFDRGGFIYTGRVKALAESARENGLEF